MGVIVSASTGRDDAGYLIWTCQLDDGKSRDFRLVPSSDRKMFEFMRDMARMGLDEKYFATNPRAVDIAEALVGRTVE